jgi:dynein intermediate chain, cytosolic
MEGYVFYSEIDCLVNPVLLLTSFAYFVIFEYQASLVTTSTDGRLNFWSVANLRDPAESIQVGDSISCCVVVPETETLVLGDEHGTLYTIAASTASVDPTSASTPAPSAAGKRVGRRQAKKWEATNTDGENLGHYGMITSISAKSAMKPTNSSPQPRSASLGFSKGFLRGGGGLLVSSGVDWTVKLWAPAYHDKPLMSWLSHSYDYMSDVAWSPTHPSLFATASSNGTIGFWNLTSSFEEPITGPEGILVEPDAMSGAGLNKLKWSADGRRMAVASSDRVHILNLSDEVLRVKGDEETKMMHQLLSRGLIERQ